MNPSDTPKTDASEYELISNVRPAMVVDAKVMRQLERELNAQIEANRILRLGEQQAKNQLIHET